MSPADDAREPLLLPEPLRLSNGGRLEHPLLAWRSWGEPRPEDPVVLLHGLSRSHCAFEPDAPERSPHGWANKLFGAGQPFDPARHWILSPGLLGSPFGSTSAAAPELPDRPFPELSVTDLADALHGFLKAKGVTRVRALVGFSLGGMVALAFAARHPAMVRSLATLGGPAALPAMARRRMGLVATMLLADPEYRADGQGEGAARALRRVRLAMLRDLHPFDFALRGGAFEAERVLEAQADAFAKSHDARCYLSLCRAMASADLTESLSTVKARCLVASISSDPLAAPQAMRDTYHALTATGARTRYFEMSSEAGHHAFYAEPEGVASALHDIIGG